jgi:hypothetical protein
MSAYLAVTTVGTWCAYFAAKWVCGLFDHDPLDQVAIGILTALAALVSGAVYTIAEQIRQRPDSKQ